MEVMHADRTRVGANFLAKRAQENPREIVLRLVEQHRDKSKDELFEMFRLAIEDDEALLRAVQWYFFVNMYEYEVTTRNRKGGPAPRQYAAQRQARVNSIKAQVLSLSLSFVMPNGKALRDCTGTECTKAGGWLAKIGKKAGSKKIGTVFKDDAALVAALR